MLVQKRVVLERFVQTQDETKKAIEEDINKSFYGKHYCGIGVIQSADINAIGMFRPSINRWSMSVVPYDVTFNVLSIPPGTIIPNARLHMKKQNNNNTTYLFVCKINDIDGRPFPTSTMIINGQERDGIVATISTMNKGQQSTDLYKHLVEGSMVNLVCLHAYPAEGKSQALAFNADIITSVPPKYFKYTSMIDIDRIKKLTTKAKVDYVLFGEHNAITSKYTETLTEGTVYAMTIYGFTPATSDLAIDFIVKPNTSCNSAIECEIGMDTLSNYLYYTMYNWKCVLETLKSN